MNNRARDVIAHEFEDAETPYFCRRAVDKSLYEVGVRTNADWRHTVSDDESIIARYPDDKSALSAFCGLVAAFRAERILNDLAAAGLRVVPAEPSEETVAALTAAAALITTQAALLARAREVLTAFGVCADDWHEMGDTRIVNQDRVNKGDEPIFVSELRAARALAAEIAALMGPTP
jgi:hypothetical protein